jgi:hypothetical protein
MVGVKLYDLYRAVETGPPPRAWEFLTYLPNGCNLVLRRVAVQNHPPRRDDAIRLLWVVPITITCGLTVTVAWRFNGGHTLGPSNTA